jgi:hypothetical protein
LENNSSIKIRDFLILLPDAKIVVPRKRQICPAEDKASQSHAVIAENKIPFLLNPKGTGHFCAVIALKATKAESNP